MEEYIITGELSLDGEIKPIKGALSMAVEVRNKNKKGMILPEANAQEAAVVDGCVVYPVKTLTQVIDFFDRFVNSIQ